MVSPQGKFQAWMEKHLSICFIFLIVEKTLFLKDRSQTITNSVLTFPDECLSQFSQQESKLRYVTCDYVTIRNLWAIRPQEHQTVILKSHVLTWRTKFRKLSLIICHLLNYFHRSSTLKIPRTDYASSDFQIATITRYNH